MSDPVAEALLDETHDMAARCWVEGADGHPDFPVQNLPLGAFASHDGHPRCVMAIGDRVLDLAALAPVLDGEARAVAEDCAAPVLNPVVAHGNRALRALRRQVFALLTDPAQRAEVQPHLLALHSGVLKRPFAIGNYTDFYAGIAHATNVGALFRPDNPLLPNYKHVPIGYHGRASSVRVSPGAVVRPWGQTKAPDVADPGFGPTRKLDYELEVAIWIGQGNPLGAPIPVGEAVDHIVGLGLLNDWSARDIQAWEYQPLGPFLAKNFHSTVSPWVVTLDALAPFRVPQPKRPASDPQPLPYLTDAGDQARGAFAITLEVSLLTASMRAAGLPPQRLSSGSMESMYWTSAQLLAHHASNGCDLEPGDLLGTGTLSGTAEHSWGSLIELTHGGKQPITLPDGKTRTFLEDGDTVILTAFAEREGFARIGFGEASGTILPPR